jgi:hypothetical protein
VLTAHRELPQVDRVQISLLALAHAPFLPVLPIPAFPSWSASKNPLQDFVCKHVLVRIVIGERLHVPKLSVDLFLGGTLFDVRVGFFVTSKLKALLMTHAVFLSSGFARLTV